MGWWLDYLFQPADWGAVRVVGAILLSEDGGPLLWEEGDLILLPEPSSGVVDDLLPHDAIQVWLAPASRDVVGGVQMRTAPPPVVHDDIAVGEGVAVRVGMAVAVVDDTPGSEAVTVRAPIPVLGVDAVVVGEVVQGRFNVLGPAVGDDLPPSEAVTLALPLPGVLAVDTVVPDDVVELRLGLTASDTLTPADAVAVVLPMGATAVDQGAPAEAVEVALNVLIVQVADAIPVEEAVDRRQPITLVAADTIVVGERRVAETAAPKKVKIKNPRANPNAGTQGP